MSKNTGTTSNHRVLKTAGALAVVAAAAGAAARVLRSR